MKISLKKIMMTGVLALASVTNVYAQQEAMSIGTNFGDGLDSSNEASIATNAFSTLGYHSNYNNAPSTSNIPTRVSNYNSSSNTAGALFFHGHGSKYTIQWNYLGKGGIYNVGFKYPGQSVSSSTTFYPLSNINLSNTKIGIFMGCNTAQSTDNIAKYAHTAGATVTTGWVYVIYEGDTDDWTEAFFSKLTSGGTFKESYKYANSLSYTHNENMKTHRVYGTSTVSGTASSNSTATISDFSDTRNSLTVKISDDVELSDFIINTIKENFDESFDISNYSLEESEGPDGLIYDYNYMIDDAKTTHGYTVFVEDGNIEIYDNMAEFVSTNITNTDICLTSYDESDVETEISDILDKYRKQYSNYNISLDSTLKTYDDDLQKIILNVYIKVEDKEIGATSIYREML